MTLKIGKIMMSDTMGSVLRFLHSCFLSSLPKTISATLRASVCDWSSSQIRAMLSKV